MKYYSDKTKKLYPSVVELEEAEKTLSEKEAEEKAKREQRAERAKEVEEAYKKYRELLDKFLKDYGSYHTSITTPDSLLDWFFDWPF